MTRFQIVAIFDDKTLSAGEFNGDGYFEGGHGEEICSAFSHIKTEEDYRKIVVDINNQYFEYDENMIYEVTDIKEYLNFYELKKQNLYFRIWGSDYLYIINLSDCDKKMVDINNVEITVKPFGWVTIHFGELYNQDTEDAKVQCRSNCEIDNFSWFEKICDEQGWTAEKTDDEITIARYTPAGEDFGFDVDAKDAINEIKRYADDFDVDEHVKMWIGGRGAPSSIRCLLEDAEWINEKLQELVKALEK